MTTCLAVLLVLGAAPPPDGKGLPLPAGATMRIASDSQLSLATGLHYSPDGKAGINARRRR